MLRIINVLSMLFILYLAFLVTWLVLVTACEMENNEGCGDNTMTYVARWAYSPVVGLIE